MSRVAINFTHDYGSVRYGCVYDPGTLMAASMITTAAAGGLAASSTLAGGDAAELAGQMSKRGAEFQATQLKDNAAQSFAAGQRKALAARDRTRLAISTSTARAAASGVDAGVGSPADNVGELAKRGEYHALMEMFNGESDSTGMLNQAAGVTYGGEVAELEGKMKKSSSRLQALGTLAGTASSMMSTYGNYKYPTTSRARA